PLVFARVYDSSSIDSADFGPGWRLSAAETISVSHGAAHLTTDNGSTIEFVETGESNFRLARDYPSDFLALTKLDPVTLRASLRTGLVKEFKVIGELFRLTRVVDNNGNEVRLSYENGLLKKLENENHFILLKRNKSGRIVQVQDDALRSVSYTYDEA